MLEESRGVGRVVEGVRTRRLGRGTPRFRINSAMGMCTGVGRNGHREVRIFRKAILGERNNKTERAFAMEGASGKVNIRGA